MTTHHPHTSEYMYSLCDRKRRFLHELTEEERKEAALCYLQDFNVPIARLVRDQCGNIKEKDEALLLFYRENRKQIEVIFDRTLYERAIEKSREHEENDYQEQSEYDEWRDIDNRQRGRDIGHLWRY